MNQTRLTLPLKGLIYAFVISAIMTLLVGVIWLFQYTAVFANVTDISSAEARYPGMVGSRIDNCSLCHTASIPSLNPYGAAYKAAGRNPAALAAIESLDSDGDTYTNLQEITALTYPGDPKDHPIPATPTSAPTATATVTMVPPTATKGPPTATRVPPTATGVPPTATKAPPTATQAAPTATQPAPTATQIQPKTTQAAPSETPTLRPTRTPRVKPTQQVCLRDSDLDQEELEQDDSQQLASPTPDQSVNNANCKPETDQEERAQTPHPRMSRTPNPTLQSNKDGSDHSQNTNFLSNLGNLLMSFLSGLFR